MNKIKKQRFSPCFACLAVCILLMPAVVSGMLVCHGPDGHMNVELARDEHCCSDSDDATQDVHPAVVVQGRVPCLDVAFMLDVPLYAKGKSATDARFRSAYFAPLTFNVQFISFVVRNRSIEMSMCPVPFQSLSLLRTVILLV